MNPIIRNEFAHKINGVEGRMFATTVRPLDLERGTFCKQEWSATRPLSNRGKISVTLRFDDELKNGHNSFGMTYDAVEFLDGRKHQSGGAGNEEIAKHFPELAHLAKWHLCATDGPMHYLANATYLASNRDHWGRAKGEPSRFEHTIRFADSPVSHRISDKLVKFLQSRLHVDPNGEGWRINREGGEFTVVAFAHEGYRPHYSFTGFGEKWHEAPFTDQRMADEWCVALNTCRVQFESVPVEFSEGKARDLDGARRIAVWPEASDEDLTAPGLKERLEARLPALIAAFRTDMEACGFLWSSAEKSAA